LLFNDTNIYSQWELKALFLQEVFARGILMIGSHNMSCAHSDEDISKLLEVHSEVFEIIKEVLENRNLNDKLQAEPLVPLFKIR
jgi:glutamate-1-semialdehyde 2,1-aminomutase